MTFQIQLDNSDVAFECKAGQTILDAALQAGISVPYSCRKGVCGNCAGQVTRGEVQPHGTLPLRNDTCSPAQVLYCGCEPATDLRILPVSWQKMEDGAPKTYKVKVYRNERAAPDVSILQLRLPAGKKVKFRAGQYLLIRMEDGSTRSYSMANPPHESDSLTLHIRHVPGGLFSSKVANLSSGDCLEVELPYGHVELQEEDTRPLLFIAGGTGFAPVKSLLDSMAKKKVQRPITLLWGAREQSGLYMQAAVDKWKKAWPDFSYIPALDQVGPNPEGNCFAGRPDEAMANRFSSLQNHVVYVCGAPAMVEAIRTKALQLGARPADIHADAFVTGPTNPQ